MIKQNNIQNALGYCEFALAQCNHISLLNLFKKIVEQVQDKQFSANMFNTIS